MFRTIKRITRAGLLILLTAVVFLTPIQVHALSPCSTQTPAWQKCGPIESPSGISTQPSTIQTSDGGLSMAWMGHPSLINVILYTTASWNGTGWNWGIGANVAGHQGINQNPSLVQLPNGTIYIFFAFKATGGSHFQLYYITQNGGLFSTQYTPVPLTNPTSLNDTLPSATVSRDGTLWLVWTRDNSTRTGTQVMRQLWYKTASGSNWSVEQPLTQANDINWNSQPSVVAGRDGTIRVAFLRGASPPGDFQIFYMTFNGSVWSSPIPLTTQTTTQDVSPSIAQDRNGTYWVFWARNVPAGTSTSYVLYSRYSIDNGATWSPETALTSPACGTVCSDDETPSAVQSTSDKNLWVFYSTNNNPTGNFNIYALKTTNPIAQVHDVSISYFSPNASQIYAGGFHDPYTANGVPISQSAIIQILVVFQNIGDFSETVTLGLTLTNTTMAGTTSYTLTSQVLSVAAGSQSLTYFFFNSLGDKPARYGISGNASIAGRTLGNKQDGILFTPNLVHLIPWGDVDQDGAITISDVTVVFYNYGFTCYTPATCSPRYLNAIWGDVNGNGVIDISDATTVSRNYGIYT